MVTTSLTFTGIASSCCSHLIFFTLPSTFLLLPHFPSRRLVPLSQLQVAKEIHYPFASLAGRLLSPCTHTHSPNPSCFHSPEVGGDSMLCFTEKLKPFPEHDLSRVTSSLELNSDCTMISWHSGVKVLHVNPSSNRDPDTTSSCRVASKGRHSKELLKY